MTDVHLAAKVLCVELGPPLVALEVDDGPLLDVVPALADDGHGGLGAVGAGGGQPVVLALDGVGADPDVGDGVHDHLGGVVVLGPADLQLQLLFNDVDAGHDLAREVGVVDAVVDDSIGRFLPLPREFCYRFFEEWLH